MAQGSQRLVPDLAGGISIYRRWFLVSSLTRKQRPLERHDLAINKENDQSVAIKLEYGAGKLELGPSENPSVLVEGALLGEFAQVVTRDGNRANIKLSAGPHMFMDWPTTWFPWVGNGNSV